MIELRTQRNAALSALYVLILDSIQLDWEQSTADIRSEFSLRDLVGQWVIVKPGVCPISETYLLRIFCEKPLRFKHLHESFGNLPGTWRFREALRAIRDRGEISKFLCPPAVSRLWLTHRMKVKTGR